MKVRRLLRELTVPAATPHGCPKLLELIPHQFVQAFMPELMLKNAGFVAEAISTLRPDTVVVSDGLTIRAAYVAAVVAAVEANEAIRDIRHHWGHWDRRRNGGAQFQLHLFGHEVGIVAGDKIGVSGS